MKKWVSKTPSFAYLLKKRSFSFPYSLNYPCHNHMFTSNGHMMFNRLCLIFVILSIDTCDIITSNGHMITTPIPHITLNWYIQKGISDYSPSLFSTPLWCYNITNPSYYFGLWYIQKGISDYSLFFTPLNHIPLKHMVMGSIPGHWVWKNICWERSTP